MVASVKNKLAAPVLHPDSESHRRMIAEVLNRVLDGASNAIGSVTLDANASRIRTLFSKVLWVVGIT